MLGGGVPRPCSKTRLCWWLISWVTKCLQDHHGIDHSQPQGMPSLVFQKVAVPPLQKGTVPAIAVARLRNATVPPAHEHLGQALTLSALRAREGGPPQGPPAAPLPRVFLCPISQVLAPPLLPFYRRKCQRAGRALNGPGNWVSFFNRPPIPPPRAVWLLPVDGYDIQKK